MGANAPRRGVVAQDPYRAPRKLPLRRYHHYQCNHYLYLPIFNIILE